MNPAKAYVLRLEDECWYIGVTTNLKHRFVKHLEGKAASWTRLHKPIEIFKVFTDYRVETKLTLAFMKIYGINKVRGAGMCSSTIEYKSQTFINRVNNVKIPDRLCDELGVPHLKYKPIEWEVKHKITLPF